MFLKLLRKGVPRVLLDIVMAMHSNLLCRVKWDNCYSSWFQLSAGVRQGGVLSPDLYCLYVDDLIGILKSLNVGCYVKGIFAAAIFYADDMAVIAPSVGGLQKLLNACATYCSDWDIKLNSSKTKNIFFGKGICPSACVTVNGNSVPWSDEALYLGVTLRGGKTFDCNIKTTIAKFYRSLNAILRIEGRSDDLVMLRLLEAHCLPILTYGIEVISVSNRDEYRQMRVAYNAIYRKMFGYSYRESVTLLQHSLGRPTWEELTEKRLANFKRRCNAFPLNPVIRQFT